MGDVEAHEHRLLWRYGAEAAGRNGMVDAAELQIYLQANVDILLDLLLGEFAIDNALAEHAFLDIASVLDRVVDASVVVRWNDNQYYTWLAHAEFMKPLRYGRRWIACVDSKQSRLRCCWALNSDASKTLHKRVKAVLQVCWVRPELLSSRDIQASPA